jgi:hypothetical protein
VQFPQFRVPWPVHGAKQSRAYVTAVATKLSQRPSLWLWLSLSLSLSLWQDWSPAAKEEHVNVRITFGKWQLVNAQKNRWTLRSHQISSTGRN